MAAVHGADLPGNPITFRVKAVKSNGRVGSSCSLLLSADRLYYLKQGRNPERAVFWPLNTIRGFGTSYDGKLFMFRAGRRAPNGEGVYAFKTDEARRIQAAFERWSRSAADNLYI